MAASALMKEVGGPLSGVFDQVISENEDALPQVQNFSYEDGGGIVGKVDGKTILIGDRSLLINHRLQVPPREEEAQYASGNQQVVYIGVDSEVAALLVLTYTADRRRKNELQRLGGQRHQRHRAHHRSQRDAPADQPAVWHRRRLCGRAGQPLGRRVPQAGQIPDPPGPTPWWPPRAAWNP